jgi:peptidoglycan/xylan/chitin deacetylase (PgdA/CDA1 family)
MKSKSKKKTLRFNWRIAALVVLLLSLLVLLFLQIQLSVQEGTLPLKYSQDYPRSTAKLPPDVLRDRIATSSAKSIRVPIMMYHYVEYVADKNDKMRIALDTTPAMLDAQLAALAKANYATYFMRDVPGLIAHPETLAPKTIVLTFDDGYADFYTGAFPVLEKHKMKATVYVMANFINRAGYLTDKQIKALIASGLVEIGSHTLDHPDLRAMKKDLARKEIVDNKTRLEKEFGISAPSFAYPYGGFSKETIQMVKDAGYTSAVSVIPGTHQSEENLFYLYRLRPGHLGLPDPVKTLEAYKG